jgi:hypothetical protein
MDAKVMIARKVLAGKASEAICKDGILSYAQHNLDRCKILLLLFS